MIIGIVGPLCSGKDTVAKLIADEGFESISTGDFLRDEMREKGIELTRENMQEYIRKMRKKEGLKYPSNRIVKTLKEGKDYLIQGLRNAEEGGELKKLKDFYLVSVNASEEIRFERMKKRAREKDPITFEEFKKIDDLELYGKGGKGYGFNIKECMDLADEVIVNDGNLQSLKEKIIKLLKELRKV